MKKFSQSICGLFILIILLNLSQQVVLAQTPTNEVKLSSTNANSPEIAISDFYVAVAYAQGGSIYLKSATAGSGWVERATVGTGTAPRLLFKAKEPNTVQVIWLNESLRQIQSTSCTLKSNVPPTCATAQTVKAGGGLSSPTLALDKTGNLYAAWANSESNAIELAKLTVGGSSWLPVPAVANLLSPKKPTLAMSDNALHLAFENGSNISILYYRSTDGGNTWTKQATYTAPSASFPLHDKLNNPTMQAVGKTVYLAWDAHHTAYKDGISDSPIEDGYGLVWASSTDEGATWPDKLQFVGTNQPTDNETVTDRRLSQATTTSQIPSPSEEIGLRPSMAISGTTMALVWQQRPNSICTPSKIGAAQVYYAYDSAKWFNSSLGQSNSNYNINVKMVVGSDGKTHLVFMRANLPSIQQCSAGGSEGDYAIYYLGEFIKTANPAPVEDKYPVLSITKAGPVTSTVNGEFIYTLVVANNGNASATEVVITDTLPANVSYVSGGKLNGSVVQWDSIKELPVGVAKEVNFVVKSPAQAMVVVNQDYGVRANGGYVALGELEVETEVIDVVKVGKPSLKIIKTAPTKVDVGGAITYTLTVVNSGDAPATGLLISDGLPAGATYLSGGTFANNTVSWAVDSLAQGNGIVTKTFIVAAQKTVTNTDYQVTAQGGYRAVGEVAVVTMINDQGGIHNPNHPPDDTKNIYLPVILKK